MDLMNYLGWVFALSAMGMAGAAMQEVASLRQEVRALADELHRRGPNGAPAAKR